MVAVLLSRAYTVLYCIQATPFILSSSHEALMTATERYQRFHEAVYELYLYVSPRLARRFGIAETEDKPCNLLSGGEKCCKLFTPLDKL